MLSGIGIQYSEIGPLLPFTFGTDAITPVLLFKQDLEVGNVFSVV